MLTLAGPHSGTSAEPSVNSIPKSLVFSVVTGRDSIMYWGWSSVITQRTFRRPVCAASLDWNLKEARAAAPPTPKRNVLLFILRFIDSPFPSLGGFSAYGLCPHGLLCLTLSQSCPPY